MPVSRRPDSDTPVRAVALIDPYWLVGQTLEPSAGLLHAIQRAAGAGVRIERFYWYLETGSTPHPLPTLPRVTLRVAARDDLDDGFEPLRAMDADLRAVAGSGRFDAVVLATHDDRLALTVEWAQSQGLLVLGCATSVEEPDPRIQRIVDEVIEPRLAAGAREEDQALPTEEALGVITEAVGQWQAEADPLEADRVRQFVERRPGLPRPVDSRLLFLARKRLGRELSEGERVALRRRFREGVLGGG